MKTYIATHEFKSKELQEQYFQAVQSMTETDIQAAVTGDQAKCQMNFSNGSGSMKMFCWWEATSSQAIIDQLGDMNSFFDTECHEMGEVLDLRT
tara:strand:- start:82 stop:363 length:282 start_codon:yes stop_codon:yes gene_type:complete